MASTPSTAAAPVRAGRVRSGPWGYHLLIDGYGGDPDAVTSPTVIEAFGRELVGVLGMRPFGPPEVIHFAEEDPHAAGWTLVQLIYTSAVTGHFVDENGDFYLDVFSCKAFDPERVEGLVRRTFRPAKMASDLRHRGLR